MIELNSNSIFEEIYCEPFTKTSISTVLDAIKEVGGNCSKLFQMQHLSYVFGGKGGRLGRCVGVQLH